MNVDLLGLDPKEFQGKILSPGTFLDWLKAADAMWMYQGRPSPSSPHAELTSGLCSDGFVDVTRLLCHPNVSEILAQNLARDVRRALSKAELSPKVDWVVSSAYAAITFGHDVARELGAQFGYAEKDGEDPGRKKMLWRRLELPSDAIVLQVEELITTMGTAEAVRRAVEEGNVAQVDFLPLVATFVHRPQDLRAPETNGIVSLVDLEIRTYSPEDCPMCAADSVRLRPKSNWGALTGAQ